MVRYVCSRHGDQGAFVGVQVDIRAAPGVQMPDSLKSRSSRRYCMACWIDMMDAHMLPLGEVREFDQQGEGR